MTDTLDVTDFFFHACRKFRLTDPNTISQNLRKSRNRLATSSQLGVTFAVVQDNQILCFPTKSIIENKLTKENMNVEVKNLNVKHLNFTTIQKINDIGINSDGTLLAVLHTTNNNVFVDIHQIQTLCQTENLSPFSKIRVGNDPSNQGSAFEWNPAFSDTFAASSTDRSVMVVKIDLKDGSKQSIIGEKKMGATATVISWSPKGKQLTIGDACSKVIQLKPELDVVRCTLVTENSQQYHQVTGLCWLATTEWIVSVAKDTSGSDQDTYLMKCKKDKPTEWILLNELSYSNEKSEIPASILTNSQLLVEWNIVLAANTRTSQIIPIGKKQEDWQTWCVPEGKEIYLPTSSSDTFPVGITVDRSSSVAVSVGFDGAPQVYPAAPVVMILNNEGVLCAFHVISTSHKPCQLTSSQVIQISNMMPLSFSDQSQKTSNAPIKVLEVSKKEVKEVSPVVPMVPTVSITSASLPVPSLAVPQTPIKAKAPTPVRTETPVKPIEEGYKKTLIEYISKIDEIMKSTSGEIGKIQVASQKTNNTVCESSDIIKNSLNDSKNVLNELMNLVKSIEEMTEKSTHAVKDLDFVVDEQMTMISEAANPENVIDALRDHAEAQKLMKFNKFETSADLLNEKYVQCCELLRKIRYGLIEKEAKRKSMLISPLTSGFLNQRLESQAETETALKVMRNVSKIIMDTKERVQKNEIMLARAKKENKGEIKKEVVEEKNTAIGYVGIESQKSRNLTKDQIVSARQTLLKNFKSKGPVKTKKVNLLTFSNVPASQPTTTNNSDLSTANLTNAILKLSMTPRRQPIHNNTSNVPTPSKTCDATTQADAPPVVITVKEEEPKSPPPVLVKPKTEVKPKEEKTPVASNTFSGSLFGSKKDTPTTPSTSLFGSLKPTAPITTTVPSSNISLLPAKTTTAPSTGIFPSSTLTPKSTVTQPTKPLTTTTNQEVTTSPLPAVTIPPATLPSTTAPSFPVSTTASDVKTEPTVKPASTILPKIEEPATVSSAPTTVPPVTLAPPSAVTQPAEVVPEIVKVEEPAAVPAVKTEEPKKEPIFAFGQSTKTPEPAKPTENTISTPKSTISFGSAVSNQATPKSLFGGSTSGSSATPSSLFGGGTTAKPDGATSSPFGMFGQQQNTTQPSNPPSQSVGFSFNKPSSTPVFGGLAQPSKPTGFAAAAAAAASSNDIGMEDDTSGGGASFGSGFMSGLGSSNANQNSGGNIFSSKPAASSTSSSGNSWLFGGSTQNKPAATNSFSFASAAAQHAQQPTPQQNSSAMFGGGAKFGGAPAFGSKPAFGGGAAPGGGFLSKDASIFGGAANSGGGPGFSQFATSSPNTSSLFGGGTSTSNSAASSLFGGSASNSKGNFNSWR